ncbi:WAT1-related protein At5g07050-like isoform X1 [Euphorbia lathyris]|uniref:WAT1-related protein At5g07050-like isoform X1 n=1 Tax=Euphorbia lathyris TaxID=212925 RepID=UPI003313B986
MEDFVGEKTEKKWIDTISEKLKSYILCVFCSFCFAGFNIISKVSLDKGMSLYVLVAYAYVFGTVTTAILALLFERNNESKISLPICIQIFFLGLLGVLARIFYYAGLECTSSTFAGAMLNLIPSVTFILAILCRMEKLNLKEVSGQAKVGGTIVAFGGATVMTLYKGITVISGHNNHHPASSKQVLDGNLIKGSLFLLLQSFFYASSYVLQASTIKKYPAPIALTTLTCLSGIPIATSIAAILDHKPSSWKLSFDITLVAPIYCGIMVYGITTYINTVVMRTKGPVFVTAFFPLITVIVAIMGLLILNEALHLGGIIGAVLIIIGLYAMLWGQEYEKKRRILEPPICDEAIQVKSQKK